MAPDKTLDVTGTFRASGDSLIGGTLGVTGAVTAGTVYMGANEIRNSGTLYIQYTGNNTQIGRDTATGNSATTIFGTLQVKNKDASGNHTNLLNVKRVGDAAVLEIGSENIGDDSTQNTTATIKLGSAAGDQNSYEHCVIERREWNADEGSELLLFSGNDIGGTNAASYTGSGPDRIRLRAGAILFDTYSSASSDRTAESIRMVINKDGNVGIGSTAPAAKLDVKGGIRLTLNSNHVGIASGIGGADLDEGSIWFKGAGGNNTDGKEWLMQAPDGNDYTFDWYYKNSSNAWKLTAYIDHEVEYEELNFTGQHRNITNNNDTVSYTHLTLPTKA